MPPSRWFASTNAFFVSAKKTWLPFELRVSPASRVSWNRRFSTGVNSPVRYMRSIPNWFAFCAASLSSYE